MLIAPYINDNPYRLLGVGAVTLQADLERAAETAAKTAQLGIPPASALMQVLGAEMMPRCVEKVQMFRADPLERTVYRLFWPFDYQRRPEFKGTLADLLGMDALEPAPSFRVLQLRFVINWLRYLLKPSGVNMATALESFDQLCREEALSPFLSELLLQEGETETQAQEIGHRAPHVVLERVLVVFRRQAAQWWENGEIDALIELVQKLSSSGFAESIEAQILPDVLASANREADRLRALTQSFSGWTATQPPFQPAEVAKLRHLARGVIGRIPAAQEWLQVVESRVRQVAGAMRQQALELAEDPSRQAFALQILAHLQTFPLPEDLALKIRGDEERIAKILNTREAVIWKDFTPTNSGPPLTTVNGFGCMVYGRKPFVGDPDWYLTTYYFVILFLPIFPIRRYLVKNAPGGGWYFRASAPLTIAGKCHLGLSMATLLFVVLYGLFLEEQLSANNYQYRTPVSAYGTRSSGPRVTTGTEATSPLNAPPGPVETEEHRRLNEEFDRRNTALDADKEKLDQRKAALDRAAKQLDADRKHVNRYSSRAVNAYNARIRSQRKTTQRYNADVEAYNKRLRHLQEIAKKLDKSGT